MEEECGEGEIVVELESCQVERVGIDETDADEAVEEWGEVCGFEDGGVDAHAGEAGDAAEDDEERFAGGFGGGEALGEIVVDPAGVILHGGLVVADGSLAVLDGFGGEGERGGEEEGECGGKVEGAERGHGG